MLFVFLCALILIGAIIFLTKVVDSEDRLMLGIVSVLPIVVLGMVSFGLSLLIGWIATGFNLPDEPAGSVQLQAINTGSDTQGSFFLGSGTVNEQNVYNYYYRDGTGFRMGQIDADSTLVVESDTTTPHIDFTHKGVFPSWTIPGEVYSDVSYTVYVPVGSVQPNIDMTLPKG